MQSEATLRDGDTLLASNYFQMSLPVNVTPTRTNLVLLKVTGVPLSQFSYVVFCGPQNFMIAPPVKSTEI